MKTIMLFLLLLSLPLTCILAQQSPRTLFSPLNWQLMNPGSLDRWMFDGAPTNSCMFTSGLRLDGVGGKDSPMTFFLSGEAMANANFHWGGSIYGDKTGAISTIDGSLMGQYIAHLGAFAWSIGLQPRLFSYHVAVSQLTPEQTGDPLLSEYDGKKRGYVNFEAGCGLFLKHKTDWYIGVSTLSLIALTRHKGRATGRIIDTPERRPQMNFVIGYDYKATDVVWQYNCGLNVVKNLYFYTVGPRLPVSGNVNVRLRTSRARLDNDFWVGSGISTNGMWSVDTGWEKLDKKANQKEIPKWRLGISINFPVWYRRVGFGGSPVGTELTFAHAFQNPFANNR